MFHTWRLTRSTRRRLICLGCKMARLKPDVKTVFSNYHLLVEQTSVQQRMSFTHSHTQLNRRGSAHTVAPYIPQESGGVWGGGWGAEGTFASHFCQAAADGINSGNRQSDTSTVARLVSQGCGPPCALTPPLPDATKNNSTHPPTHPTSSPQIAFTLLTPRVSTTHTHTTWVWMG